MRFTAEAVLRKINKICKQSRNMRSAAKMSVALMQEIKNIRKNQPRKNWRYDNVC